MIFLIALAFRVMKGKYGAYMDAFDPLFQYRVTEYIVENGYSAWFTWHDTLSWYPFGRDIATSSYPGIPFTAAFVYQVLHFFGSNISVYNICLYFPAFMGAITCVAMYYLGRLNCFLLHGHQRGIPPKNCSRILRHRKYRNLRYGVNCFLFSPITIGEEPQYT